MTLDEAKARLADLRDFIRRGHVGGASKEDVQALGIALWLMEREPLAQAVFDAASCIYPGNVVGPSDRLHEWESENPKPFTVKT